MPASAPPRQRQSAPPPQNERAVAVRSEAGVMQALSQELDRRREVIEDSAASLIDIRRLKGVVLSVFSRRPELWECDPISVARAVVECAQVGLEPTGAIGGAHLVPFFNSKTGRKEAQLIIDYRGGVALARRSGEVKRVEARVVREKDEFDFQYGLEPTLTHVPALVEDPGPMKFAYAVAVFSDGSRQFEVMSAAQIEAVRQRSRAKDSGPWVSDHLEMAKKTVLKRLLKLLPLSIEARRILELEDEQERESASPRGADRGAQMRSTLRDRVARGFTNAGAVESPPDAVEEAASDEAIEGEATDVGAAVPASEPVAAAEPASAPPAAEARACGMPSPFTEGETCGLAPGHSANHRSRSRESWS